MSSIRSIQEEHSIGFIHSFCCCFLLQNRSFISVPVVFFSCAVINSIPAGATANFYCRGMTGRLVNVFLQTTDMTCVLTLCEVEVYGELAAPSPSFTASVMGRNIAVVENKLSWPDALFYCRNFYWDLLSIRTEEEQRLVQEVLAMASFPLTNELWVGLRRYLNDGTWFWMTGQSVTYSNWKTTLVWQYTKQCGAMETSEGFFWRDLPCDEPLHFICLTDNDLTQLSVDFFSTIRPTAPQPSTWKDSALAQYT
ncbi:macrophage mannose receptor 1-like isoform X1 [Mastacembelus armatus]|uniref:macrophage mannose receptor 1-like isoform X1 n=2 Tax=Mastacembelus armatus TaxID=205130 RepID=UPI000E45D3F6|nr:macrophage mannose receptor 1-like isoform X1 [Mastacembelus armatus]